MEHRTQIYPVHTSWYMLCAGLLYLLALVCAWVYDYTSWNTEQRNTQFIPLGTCFVLVIILLALACAWEYDYTSTTWITEHKRYPVHTSWYMLCACLLYLLALVCAWEYDYTSTTWITEQRDTQFIPLGRCFVLVYLFTSTSLCLRV